MFPSCSASCTTSFPPLSPSFLLLFFLPIPFPFPSPPLPLPLLSSPLLTMDKLRALEELSLDSTTISLRHRQNKLVKKSDDNDKPQVEARGFSVDARSFTVASRSAPSSADSAPSTIGSRTISASDIKEKLGPIMLAVGNNLDKIDDLFFALITFFQKMYKIIDPYHPEDMLPALYGLLMLFFGGAYMLTIAAIEAAKNFGWNKISLALQILYQNYLEVREAIKTDSQVDVNNDGVKDVNALDKKELAARRALVILKAMDPQQVASALEGLTAAWIAIIATLKIRFAQAITIGISIGNIIYDIVAPLLIPLVLRVVPQDYQKWYPVVFKYGTRSIGVTIAFFVQRVINAAFCSMKGSEMFFVGLLAYLTRNNYIEKNKFDLGSPMFVPLFAVVAFFGFWWQLSNTFGVPFPLNIILLPVSILEKVLLFYTAVKD